MIIMFIGVAFDVDVRGLPKTRLPCECVVMVCVCVFCGVDTSNVVRMWEYDGGGIYSLRVCDSCLTPFKGVDPYPLLWLKHEPTSEVKSYAIAEKLPVSGKKSDVVRRVLLKWLQGQE